jgi:predicted naringenin-chalcone synthase
MPTSPRAPVALLGLGTASPDFAIGQADAAEVAKRFCCADPAHHDALPALYRRARIARRGSVLLTHADAEGVDGAGRQRFFPPPADGDDAGPSTGDRMARYAQDALPLALAAARVALTRAAVPPASLTHLVTVSCTGFAAPGVDVGLIRALGLPATTQRTHIGFMGCHGAINGLRVAHALAAADPRARVLLCAVELCSLHFQYGSDPDQLIANALFADGAGAAVIAADGPTEAWRVAASGSCLLPDSDDAITWRIGDAGFQMRLSARAPAVIAEGLRPWLTTWLAEHGLSIDAVGSWAIHPGGPRVLDAAATALGLQPERLSGSRQVLTDHGNMSSPTVLFILERLMREAAPRPCVVMAFGPGVTIEAALLR